MNCKQFQQQLLTHNPQEGSRELDDTLSRHLSSCQGCREFNHLDSGLDRKISEAFTTEELPPGLQDRIRQHLDHNASPSHRFSKPIAAAVLFFLVIAGGIGFRAMKNDPADYDNLRQLSESVIAAHLKGNTAMTFTAATLDAGLRMLKRELSFNVIVPNLSSNGFQLIGGRLCALGKCRIAYLFFKKENRISSLVIMDDSHLGFKMEEGSRFTSLIKGCHTDIWRQNGQIYAMVY